MFKELIVYLTKLTQQLISLTRPVHPKMSRENSTMPHNTMTRGGSVINCWAKV